MNLARSSIESKLLFYGYFLGMVPLVVAGLFIIQTVQTNLIEQSQTELNIVSQAMAAEITHFVEELRNDASLMADLPVIQTMELEQQAPYLTQAWDHYDRYGQLAIIDLDGQIQLTAREQAPINVSHIPSFNVAAEGQQAWVVAPALFDEQLVLHMHTPIWADATKQEQVGVLGSPIAFPKIASILDKYDHNMPASVFVLGNDNRVLIHLDPEVRESRPDYQPILDKVDLQMAPGHDSRIEGFDGITYNTVFEQDYDALVVSLTEIDELSWTVVAQKKESVILSPLRTVQLLVIAIVCTLMVLNAILLLYMRRRITGPVKTLANAAVALEAGNPEAQLPALARPDKEIFELIQAFGNMRDAVQDREHKLQEWSSNLERKVEIRTAELQALNQYLEKEIDEHKQTEKELELSRDEAQLANQAKDTFLAHMSHELRTPLNVIIGYSELIHEYADEKADMFLAEDAGSISTAARSLADIINDVLAYSEVQSHTLKMSKSSFLMEDIVLEVAKTIQPIVRENGNMMMINNHVDKAPIFSDKEKIRQILMHLLGNAAKFTREGTITLDLSLSLQTDISNQVAEDHTWLIMEIKDTGIGIEKGVLNSMFHPFKQLEEAFNRPHGGVGLGLVLTQSFVEILDGRLTVESELGEGSSFKVSLPIEKNSLLN